MTTLPEEAVKAAQDAFNKTINDPIMVPCSRCSGKGYHYGFGEDGASPDWCVECGGSAFDVVPGEEERAMRAALTAALPFLPVQGAVKKLEWENSAAQTQFGEYTIVFDEDEEMHETPYCAFSPNDNIGHYENEEAAKAAAQADYEARILSALEPSAARELALEEAAQVAEMFPECDLLNVNGNEVSPAVNDAFKRGAFAQGKAIAAAIRTLSSPEHADDLAVDRFAIAMKQKLAKKREEGRGGWENKDECSAEYLSYLLIQHIWKGDPVDIANLAMMLHQRGERVVIDSETSFIIPDHADAGKVEGDGIERAKFYHHQWPMERLLAARRDGLVDHSGGEAWRYEYSHKDEHGKYDILYRPVKNSTVPARLPSAPSEGEE